MSVIINGTTGITSPGGDVSSADNTVNGITVGKGGGSDSGSSVLGNGANFSNSTGTNTTAVGYQALYANTGSNNTGIGYQAGRFNTTGEITAVGLTAAFSNTTGSQNTAVGNNALYSNTTSSYNTAIGRDALNANTGASNSALGRRALYSNTSGAYNTGLGESALYSNTTASRNTAVGYQAGYTNTTGQYNTFLGYSAGYTPNASGNTLIGYGTGYSLTSGASNTFVGADSSGTGAGELVTTGSKNTILGRYNGNQGGLDIRTSSNNIVLSDGDGNPRGVFDNNGNFLLNTASNVSGARINIAQGSSDGVQYQIMQFTGGSGTGGNEVGEMKRQTTANVANSATTILGSMTFGELITVTGVTSSNGAIFADLLMGSYNTIAVISSNTQQNSPASRTYSVSSGALKLTMGSSAATNVTVQSLITGAKGT